MARGNRSTPNPKRSRGTSLGGNEVNPGTYETSTGQAEIKACPDNRGSWVLYLNDTPSSPYHPEQPQLLSFEYLALMADLINSTNPGTTWNAVHIGGGACSLARALIDRHPRSRHLVIEYDEILATSIRQWLPLPASPQLKIRAGDGLAVLHTRKDSTANYVIRDAFENNTTPLHLQSAEFMQETRRVLAPNGMALFNIAATSKLQIRHEIDTIGAHFNDIAVIAARQTLTQGKSGNVVVVAAEHCDHNTLRKILRKAKQPLVYQVVGTQRKT